MQIGRKIYYDKATGDIILDTGERTGGVSETTVEEDFATYTALAERVRETVGMIQLEYGQYAQDFDESKNNFHVNVSGDEPTIEFLYPEPGPEPVFRPPLSEEVAQLQIESVDTMLALTEVYETNAMQDAAREQEGVDTMLALTEAYELILALTARIEALEGGAS